MTIKEVAYKWAHIPGNRSMTTHLILHHVAGKTATPEQIHAWHLARGWAGIAYHYYVRKDGTIIRGRPETWNGGHTENYNYRSIGICFEGDFTQETMPDAQAKAGAALVADIRARYPGIIVGKHKDYCATACPGNIPFDFIVAGPSTEPQDTDAEQSDDPPPWAKDAAQYMIDNGIFRGDDKGRMNWNKPITRAEYAVAEARQRGLPTQ